MRKFLLERRPFQRIFHRERHRKKGNLFSDCIGTVRTKGFARIFCGTVSWVSPCSEELDEILFPSYGYTVYVYAPLLNICFCSSG